LSDFYTCESRAIEIRYDSEVPAEIRDAIDPILREHLWILPTYLHEVYVRFTKDDDPNASLSTHIKEEYRKMVFYIHPPWLLGDTALRTKNIRHEFVHALVDPLHTVAHQLIDTGILEEKTKAWAREEIRLAVERSTCDVEHMIDGKMRNVNPV
jgi:hypothetical protein